MFLESWTLWTLALAVLQPVHAEDTVSSGNYLIHGCNAGLPGSEASKLQSLLPQVYDGIQKVIADLQLGTASTHGYSTFFKDDSSKAEISQVFQQMAAGANVELHRAGNNNGVYIRHPTFICANDVPETDLIYNYCSRSNAPLANWLQTELVALCPIFWMIPQQARSSDCPLVVANSLAPNDDRLLKNQEALLVGSLMHFYHKHNRQMVAAIADVSELNDSDSKLNAPSYALYYAAVQAGCTKFPSMNAPHDDFRRLLEVPAISNATNSTLPIYAEIPASVPRPPDLNVLQDFCNGAVYAPNGTVCCDESTGLWVTAPVIRDGAGAGTLSASCPPTTGGTGGVGAGPGVVNTRRRMIHA